MEHEESYEDSSFTPSGFNSYPSLYFDNRDVGTFSDENRWSTGVLTDRLGEYLMFASKEDTFSPHRAIGRRIIDHIIFELQYRDGMHTLGGVALEMAGDEC